MRKKAYNRPVGGMNVDDEDRAIPLSDYRYAMNVRNAVNGGRKSGALSNLLGDEEITKYIMPYSGGTSLPNGKNRCIGAFEDTKYNTVIYFLWNSNNNHSILRYYRNNTSTDNPYGEIQQIINYNFGWTKKTRITSASIVYGDENNGDLLYWVDPAPKKINLTKANICEKKKSWDIVLPTGHAGESYFFQVVVKDYATGGNVASTNVSIAGGLTITEMLASLASQINYGVLSTFITADACNCSLTITEDEVNKYNILFSNPDFFVIPSNWYGVKADLIDRYFDRCKWPPTTSPIGEYGQDPNYVPNYIINKAFQFRLRYIYDDLEYSAAGVISQVPLGNISCDGTNNEAYNYIDVLFNDDTLLDPKTLVLLKKVEVWVLEYQSANWKRVVVLEACEFLDNVSSVNFAHYRFYNDTLSDTIDIATASKLYDNIPLESGAEVFSKNRIIDGDILEGYNAPECVSAKVQMEFVEQPNNELVKIKGKIRVLSYGMGDAENNPNKDNLVPFWQRNFYNTFPDYGKYPFWESANPDVNYVLRRGGIFHDTTRTTNNFAFFGGGGFGTGAGGDFGIRAGMEDYFDQRIPEGGWPVYVAGTEYLTISKQKNVGLATDGNGALDSSSSQNRNSIGNYLYQGGDLYSEFELTVPANSTYIIRLASHWCSFGVDGTDKLEKGFCYDLTSGVFYQNTSTNVWCVLDASGSLQKTKEITVTVGNSNIDDIGTFIVADLAPPFDTDYTEPFGNYGQRYMGWQPINGYLVSDASDTGVSDINSPNFSGLPVEKTIVTYSLGLNARFDNQYQRYSGGLNSLTVQIPIGSILPSVQLLQLQIGWGDTCMTDHNGYWFGIGAGSCSNTLAALGSDDMKDAGNWNYFPVGAIQSKIGAADGVDDIRIPSTILYEGSLSDYYNKTMAAKNFDGSDNSSAKLVSCVVPVTAANSRQNGSTFVTGAVVGVGGEPVGGVSVIFQNGKVATTRADGGFSIQAWSDLVTPNSPLFAGFFVPRSFDNRVVDSILFLGSVFCGITYPNGQLVLVEIPEFNSAATGYNPAVVYVLPNFIVEETTNPKQKAHKRGGNYFYGIRLNDDAGRLCSVVNVLEMYVPFITEDIGKYEIEDFSNVVYPANTFRYGKPTVRWVLDANTIFPNWATRFQWVRTPNLIYGRYLQWVANSVVYLSAVETSSTPEITTSFQNANATAIKISISNLIDYFAQNNDSTLSYSYEDGDRIRLIANKDLVNFSQQNYGQSLSNISDFKITSYDAETQSIIVKNNGFPLEITAGTVIEIFNAKSVIDNEQQIYYEVGEVVKINNGVPEKYSDIFTNGDTYWHGRNIPVNDDVTNFAATYPVVIESASISDFYPSQMNDEGRPGIVDPNFKQQRNPTLMRFTNSYLAINNAINGLSSLETENYLELDRAYGAVRALVFTQNTLVVVGANREISQYLGQTTIQQGNTVDAGIVALSNSFFGAPYVHSKMLGTDNKGSVVSYNGQIFGLANYIGNVWRYQGDGELCISDVKMINYFQSLSNDGVSEAIAVFDRFNEEYIMTMWRVYKESSEVVSIGGQPGGGYSLGIYFASNENVPTLEEEVEVQYFDDNNWYITTGVVRSLPSRYQGGWLINISVSAAYKFDVGVRTRITYSLPETIAWFNGTDAIKGDRWVSFRSDTPDAYCSLGSEVIKSKNGKLWVNNKNSIRNKFLGVQGKSKLNIVLNTEPDVTKNWYALYVENEQPTGFNWNIPVVKNNNGQLSRILTNIFEKREEFFFAEFKRDLNTSGVTNPIIEGRQLRSSSIELQMENDTTQEFVFRNIVAEYDSSARE